MDEEQRNKGAQRHSTRNQPPNIRHLDAVAKLAHAIFTHAPYKVSLTLFLIVLAGMAEIFGIAMLIPLLHLIQPVELSDKQGVLNQFMMQIGDIIHLEWTLLTVLGIFLAVAIFRTILIMGRDFFMAEILYGFAMYYLKKIYTYTAVAKWEYLSNYRQSDIQNMLSQQINHTKESAALLMQIAAHTGMTIIKFTLAALISPIAAILLFLICIGTLIFKDSILQRPSILGRQVRKKNQSLQAYTTDFLRGLKLAKSHNLEEAHTRKFINIITDLFQIQLRFSSLNVVTKAVSEIVVVLVSVIIAWFCLSNSVLTASELIIMIAIFLRTSPEIIKLVAQTQQLMLRIPSYSDLREACQKFENATEVLNNDDESLITLHSTLTAQDISFSYTNTNGTELSKPVLTNIDLQIPAKKITVITGASGVGKSTLAEILIGLREPSDGKILIDDAQLSVDDIRRWRRSIAYIPQTPYLFHDTIRENLLWARPEATESEIWEALHLASAKEFITALPGGLDTVVGDCGTYLSGGEQQRIALARALIRKPTLIILDESTNQLDAKNKKCILTTLTSLRSQITMVMISHSLDIIKKADKIILLDSSGVSATETWHEFAAELENIKDTENNDKTTAVATGNYS